MWAARTIQAEKLDYPGDFNLVGDANRVAVAVSGGSDSMATLLSACAWSAERHVRVSALTFDHGLRAESAREAAWVAAQCAVRGVSHVTLRAKDRPSTGLQAWAREARYSALTSWCRAEGVPVLLTGHTRDDQAETVAMREQRSSSLRSLAGIWPERPFDGIRVVRPMLGQTRDSLRAYLTGSGVGWLDDPSNTDPRFERARIRPLLSAADVERLAKVAAEAQREVSARSEAARTWYQHHVRAHPEGWFSLGRGPLRDVQADVMPHLVDGLVLALTGRKLKTEHIRSRLVSWLAGGDQGRLTAGGVVFAKRRREVLVGRESGRITERALIPPQGSIIWDYRFCVYGEPETLVMARGPGASLQGIPAFVAAALPHCVRIGGTAAPIDWEFQPKPDFS